VGSLKVNPPKFDLFDATGVTFVFYLFLINDSQFYLNWWRVTVESTDIGGFDIHRLWSHTPFFERGDSKGRFPIPGPPRHQPNAFLRGTRTAFSFAGDLFNFRRKSRNLGCVFPIHP